MSWYTNAQYVKPITTCECSDGVHDIMISDIKEESYNGTRILAIYFRVNDSSWNQIPYRHAIFEGDKFDSNFSRLCDCFGVDLQLILGGNWQPFVDKVGKAEFSHTKNKKVVTGYDPNGKPIEEWKTEKSDFVNIKLLAKGAVQPAPAQPVQTVSNGFNPAPQSQPLSQADAAGMARAFGTPGNSPNY